MTPKNSGHDTDWDTISDHTCPHSGPGSRRPSTLDLTTSGKGLGVPCKGGPRSRSVSSEREIASKEKVAASRVTADTTDPEPDSEEELKTIKARIDQLVATRSGTTFEFLRSLLDIDQAPGVGLPAPTAEVESTNKAPQPSEAKTVVQPGEALEQTTVSEDSSVDSTDTTSDETDSETSEDSKQVGDIDLI